MKLSWKNIFPIFFLFFLVVLFFLPYFISGSIPYVGDFTGSDLSELNLPFRFLVKESLIQGQAPLWTNLLSNGFPLLAEGQAGIFYPLNFLYLILPFFSAVNVGFLLNFFLAGLFTYFYCRTLKISQTGSLIAAVAFAFGGFFIFRLKHINLINAAIWLPLQFYLIEKFFSYKKKSYIIIALGAVFAIQFFAGHVQISYIAIVSSFLYFVLKLYYFSDYKFFKKLSTTFLVWLVIGVIAFGLSAIQFLPSYEFSKLAERQNWISYESATAFKYHPSNILSLGSPYIFGNPATATYQKDIVDFGVFWESNIYFGILPLLFALAALIFLRKRNKTVKILSILLFIAFLFSLGDFNPFFIFFWKLIPGIQMFRFHQRFLLLALVAFVVLAGFGFDYFWSKISNWVIKKKKNLKSKFLFNTLLPFVIVLIVAVDLFITAFNYVGLLDYSDYFSAPESVKFLEQDDEPFKVMSVRWMDSWQSIYRLSGGWQNNLSLYIEGRNLLPPNLNVFWNIPNIEDRGLFEGGLGSISRFSEFQGLLLGSRLSTNDNNKVDFSKQALKSLGLQNTKYILSIHDVLDNEGLALKKNIPTGFLPSLNIYENKYFLPRASAFFDIKELESPRDILEEMASSDFDPANTLILEKDTGYQSQDQVSREGKIEIIEDYGSNILLNTDFSQEGFLYLTNLYFPGWHAEIDNNSTEIYRANYTFTAVKVPAGKHQIKFFFLPQSYVIGKGITMVTLFAVLAFLIINFVTTKKLKKKN